MQVKKKDRQKPVLVHYIYNEVLTSLKKSFP